MTVRVTQLETDLAERLEADEMSRDLLLGHRGWALTEAASVALTSTVDELLATELDPLTTLVADRWNRIFADRPDLMMDARGEIWRLHDGRRLPFGAFSAGEQVVSLLFQRIATLAAATRVGFCWVDEPLEHLDPKTRRLAAGLLASRSLATGLNQLIVTTYEEDLARRLTAVHDEAKILYVRTGSTGGLQLAEDG